MSKGRRKIQNKKTENKPKSQANVKSKKRPKRSCQTNFAKPCSEIYKNPKENKDKNYKKISSDRITMPLGFFSEGVKSKVVRKNTNTYALNKESCNFLNEDLHALLQNAPDTESIENQQNELKSSNHMVTRSQSSQKHYKTASDYYKQLYSVQENKEDTAQPSLQLQISNEENKSMFKEIDKCYTKMMARQESFSNEISNFKYEQFKDKSDNPRYFCQQLEEQLSSVTLHSRKAQCLDKIKFAILEINNTLEGKETLPHSPKMKLHKTVNESIPPVIEHLIPKSNWSYETPNDKTLKRSVMNSCSNKIKQTILHTDSRCKTLFVPSPSVVSPKCFKSDNYDNGVSEISLTPNKNRNNNNLIFKCENNDFKYPEQSVFKTQLHIDEYDCASKDGFLFSRNSENIFNNNKLFQNIQTTYNSADSIFTSHYNSPSREPLQNIISTPDCFNLLETKRQKIYDKKERSVNFFDNFNGAAATTSNFAKENILFNSRNRKPSKNDYLLESNLYFKEDSQLDTLNNHPRCTEFQGEQIFGNTEEFLFPPNKFYGRGHFNF